MSLLHGILSAIFPPQVEALDDVTLGKRALVRGIVVPRDQIESPLTGERCVYYRYTVEDWRQADFELLQGDGFWQLTEQDEAIAEFYIQDGDRRAIVAPHQVSVERMRGAPIERVELNMPYRRAQQLMILPGDVVEIDGIVAHADDLFDEGRSYRENAERLMLCAPKNDTLSIRVLPRERARQAG